MSKLNRPTVPPKHHGEEDSKIIDFNEISLVEKPTDEITEASRLESLKGKLNDLVKAD